MTKFRTVYRPNTSLQRTDVLSLCPWWTWRKIPGIVLLNFPDTIKHVGPYSHYYSKEAEYVAASQYETLRYVRK